MNKKNYKIVVALSICMVLSIILLTSYALWKVKDGQSGSNTILGSCLEIELEEELDENDEPIIGITMEKAWPMSDEDGMASKGYTFTVKNKCDEDVNYEIVLETLKIAAPDNKMPDNFVKVRLDNGGVKRVSELEEIDNDSKATYASNIDSTHKLFTGTVSKNSPKTHTIRQWISSDATPSTIGYNYETKVKVYAGQGLAEPEYAITPEECFTFDASTGTITEYDLNNPVCSNKILVLPSTIDGVLVKSIMWNEQVPANKDPLIYNTSVNTNLPASAIGSNQWDYVDLSRAFGLEVIGDASFEGIDNGKLLLPNNLKHIGWFAFYSYNGDDLVIPDSVTFIGPESFKAYNGNSLTIGSSVETIGAAAFFIYSGNGLEIPPSVKTLGDEAFCLYQGPSLVLNEGLEIISQGAFEEYNGGEFTIPSTIKTIEEYAFVRYNENGDPNNPKVININMSEADFNDYSKVAKSFNWIKTSAEKPTLNYLVN